MNSNYYPLLKTSISELRALKSVYSKDFSYITPIFELTKSRKSKKNQGCDVYKKVDELSTIMGNKSFILDLTNEESLTNDQIESFFDDDNAFYNWTDFIQRIVEEKNVSVIPTVLAYEDTDIDTLRIQAKRLNDYCEKICIRLSVDLVSEEITENLIQLASEMENVVVIVDLALTRQPEYELKLKDASDLIQDIICVDDSLDIILVTSSFPSSVVQEVPKKEKMSSEIRMYSQDIFNELLKVDAELIYGDYGCIHPYRGESKPIIWVPRVDFPYQNKLLFERCSRDDGGYEICAERIRSTQEYGINYIDSWGCNEIDSASVGVVNGKSPSYWISVRANIHMTRMARSVQNKASSLN